MITNTFSVSGIGQVIGKVKETRNRKKINVLRSIPYAKPPIGKLRFRIKLPGTPPHIYLSNL